MRDYSRSKNDPHKLEKELFLEMTHLIKGYPEAKKRYIDILYSSPVMDGQPHQGGGISVTESKALKRKALGERCEAVEQAIVALNAKYSKTCTNEPFDAFAAFNDYSVFCHYRNKPSKNIAPDRRTWYRYRNEFAHMVAKNMNLL